MVDKEKKKEDESKAPPIRRKDSFGKIEKKKENWAEEGLDVSNTFEPPKPKDKEK